MNIVYIFPGQGSQHRGMGYDLFKKYPDLVNQASQELNYDIMDLCLKDPKNLLSQTQYTQPALYTVNALTYMEKIANDAVTPNFLAGHSLGEYNALLAAGAFDFITGLKLVQKRGELMSLAPKGAMVALLEIDLEEVERILADSGLQNVDIANINSRQQCIISGVYEEVLASDLEQRFIEAGARFIQLNVSAAFHSRCMLDIEKEFADFLVKLTLNPLSIPIVSNFSARAYTKTDYQPLITKQISNSVRWYESISWLLAHGYKNFIEVGPGDVLTKIHQGIVADPMPMQVSESVSKKNTISISPTITTNIPLVHKLHHKPDYIFMYAGQGSQYYQMGRALYHSDVHFRKNMDQLCHKVQMLSGLNLLEKIYGEDKTTSAFDDIRYTHPALFCISYSLTKMLIAHGIEPTAVAGHSLGEYIAATIAGMMELDDVLQLIVKQANLLVQYAPEGGLVVVITSPELFYTRSDIFSQCTLAGVNFENSFFVSGYKSAIAKVKEKLNAEDILSVELPVRYGFHSNAIDAIHHHFFPLLNNTSFSDPKLPIYSSALAQPVGPAQLAEPQAYFWQIVRGTVNFQKLITSTFFSMKNSFFIDVSATGSLSNFLKYSKGIECQHADVLNQFSDGLTPFKHLLKKLEH